MPRYTSPDNRIGIFKKIKEYYNYETLDDVISELFKGKLTTDSKNHTGEGIFFTSRLMDIFVVVSSKKYFTPFDAFMIYDDSVLCREQYFVRLYIDSNDVLHGSVSDADL